MPCCRIADTVLYMDIFIYLHYTVCIFYIGELFPTLFPRNLQYNTVTLLNRLCLFVRNRIQIFLLLDQDSEFFEHIIIPKLYTYLFVEIGYTVCTTFLKLETILVTENKLLI